ncbi:ABC transporter ATP-binding protein [bacterium]|nr:ABC transporter ATP-binding protein [bacterium]
MPNTILEVRHVDISYGNHSVITDLSTTFQAGSFVGLIGPNGAGKTTLLLALSGQLKPRKGHIVFQDSDVYENNLDFKRKIGFVHENPFFYPYLTAEEFLQFVARVKRVPSDEMEDQISSGLLAVGLEERQKPTSDLSLGMRKKLAIAAALLGAPQIVFLDEALNGIDVESTFRIKQVLKNLVSAGSSVILSTHALELIEKICDRYLVMKQGKIIADLSADELKASGEKREVDLEEYVIQLLSD